MSASEIVSRAVQLWWRNLSTLAGIVVVVAIPITLFSLVGTVVFLLVLVPHWNLPAQALSSPDAIRDALSHPFLYTVLVALNGVIDFAGFVVVQVVTIRAAAALHLGNLVSLGWAYRKIWKNVWMLFGAWGLLLLAATPAGMMAAFLVAGEAYSLIAVLVLPAIPVAAYIAARILFFAQYIVLDEHGARISIRSSWRLTRRSWWRTLGVFLLLSLLGFVVSLPLRSIPVLGAIVSQIVFVMATIGAVILFYDLRVRRGEKILVSPQAQP